MWPITQQTFQRRFNVGFRLIWRRDVAQRQINIETTLFISTLNLTALYVVETTFFFLTSIFTTSKQRCEYDHLKKNQVSIQKQNNIFHLQRICWAQNLVHFFPIWREICKRIFPEPQKFLKHRINWIAKSIFKPSHFVKCQLVFNFKGQVQAHYYYRNFYYLRIF